MIEETLQNIGLSKNEAEIYLGLLQYGEQSVSAVSIKSLVNRRNAYDCLKRLAHKGLVFEVISSKEIKYQAVDPSKLQELISEKKARLDSIMPKMQSLYNKSSSQHSVFIYNGMEAWKNYMQEIINVGEPFYCIGGKGAWMDKRTEYFFPHFIKEAKKNKIPLMHLFDYEVKERQHEIVKYVGKNYKFLPKNYSTPTSVDFFGDRVYLCSTLELGAVGQDANFTVIVNRQIADSFRTWFKYMWERCK